MEALSNADVIGAWCSIFLTIMVLSFLYDDNPIYKVAEHLFMGISIGYGVVEAWFSVLRPNMLDKLIAQDWIYVIPLILAIMLMLKISRKHGWIARIPIAILVAAYAAVKVTGETSGKLIIQLKDSMPNLQESWMKHGFWDWEKAGAGVFSDAFLVIALSACLIHFYFSEIDPRLQRIGIPAAITAFLVFAIGAVVILPAELEIGRYVIGFLLGLCAATPFLAISPAKRHVTRFGVMVLMLSFGASFGFTVMGRISLAIGRAQELMGQDRIPTHLEQVQPVVASLISIATVIIFLVIWKRHSPPEGA
jgi:hypothetical protein